MDDLSELYQEIIISHNKRPRNEGVLDPCTGKAEGFNPLCGDQITVYLRERDGLIGEVAFSGQGCAISKASASMMTTAVKGLPRAAAEAKIRELTEMLTSKEEPQIDLDSMDEINSLVGVRKFPARIKCATLAWHALEAAMLDGDAVSTE